MAHYTVVIEASDKSGEVWQALAPAENVEENGTPEEVAEWTAGNQNLASGPGWRVRVWAGVDADTTTPPDGECVAPGLTSVFELVDDIVREYDVPFDTAIRLISAHAEEVYADSTLWDTAARSLTGSGVEVVREAFRESYYLGLSTARKEELLAELKQTTDTIEAKIRHRDELIRLLMQTRTVPRDQIAHAAKLSQPRLYQIRDGRN